MAFLGSDSGFKTARDLLLFVVGLGICLFHVLTVTPSELSMPLLLFGAGMAGSPSVLRKDEERRKK